MKRPKQVSRTKILQVDEIEAILAYFARTQ